MNKITLFMVGFVVIVAGSVGFLMMQSNDKNDSLVPQPITETNKSPQNHSKTDETNPSLPITEGKYVTYDNNAIAAADGQAVLFFHAPWCPQCRQLESEFKENGVPEGYTVIETDYDSNQALRQKYGVTIQTTFVKVKPDGELIDRHTAYNEPTVEALKRDFLR